MIALESDEFATVASAIADELNTLRHSGEALQELIGKALQGGGFSASALVDLQAADVLVQTLDALAAFLKTYAQQTASNSNAAFDVAIKTVVVGALANRLVGARTGVVEEAQCAEPEFF